MWRINTFPLLIFFILSAGSSMGQQDAGDTLFVRQFEKTYNLRAIGQHRPVLIQIEEENSGESILYRPNSRPLVGFGGAILNIGFAFVLKLPEPFGLNPDTYGNTRFHDFAVNWFLPEFTFDFHYQYYEGFYVSNINFPDMTLEKTLLKPSLAQEGYSLNGVYVFNQEEFLYATTFNNANKQLRSAGSFVSMASVKHTKLRSGGTLVPAEYTNEFSSLPQFSKGEFTGFSLMPGYAQSFILGDFYLSLVFAVGPDLQYKENTLAGGKEYDWKIEGKMNMRAGIGYDNGKFFTGILYQKRRNNFSIANLNVVQDSDLIRLSVGHRFNDTSWMSEIRNWKLYQMVMNPFNN